MRNLEKVKQLAPDLRHTEPRATHEELGGEPHAARTLDKARATLAGVNGEYRFGCPMDQHFFEETGIDYLFVNSGTDFPSIVEAFARAGLCIHGRASLPRIRFLRVALDDQLRISF